MIGLIPAGGLATRLGASPCSKEVYPIGFYPPEHERSLQPKAVCDYLLESMRLARIRTVYVVLRKGKWDIPEYLNEGAPSGMHMAYLLTESTQGVPYTVDRAFPFVREATIVFGFPDILFQPETAISTILERLSATDAQVVLGLFPTDHPHKWDMVADDDRGRIRRILLKPERSELTHTWAIAAWNPSFSLWLHEFLKSARPSSANGTAPGDEELHISAVLQAAIEQGLPIEGVRFTEGSCLDIGTPEDMVAAADMLRAGSFRFHARGGSRP